MAATDRRQFGVSGGGRHSGSETPGHDCQPNPEAGASMKNRPFHQRLGFAFAGLREAWRLERSLRTQSFMAALAVVVTIVLRPGLFWAALVVLSIAMVLALELVNASIEYMIDHLHPDVAPQIKLAKDVAAAAVLIASLGAASMGALMIFAVLSR